MKKEYVSGSLGQAIKDARKKLRLSQIDLANELEIGSSTVSIMERAYKQVSSEHLQKVCSFLGIDQEKYAEELDYEVTELDVFRRVQIIELEMEENPATALEELRRYEEQRKFLVGKEDLMSAFSHYLRGKIADKQRFPEEALSHFELAIRFAQVVPELQSSNMIAACYYLISRIYHRQNKLKKALAINQKGFDTFDPQGQHSYLYYTLYVHKASILEKLNQDTDALKVIEGIWDHKEFLQFSDLRLNMYQIRVEILVKLGRYHEAIQIAEEGLDLARLERNEDRKFELLSSLGEAHARLGDLNTAEVYYQFASKLEPKIRDKHLAITTYTQLGKIYIQQGNLTKAEGFLQTAVQVGEHQDNFRLCRAMLTLGECYFRQKKVKKATNILERSLHLCRKLGLDDEVRAHLVLLTEIAFRSKSSGYENYLDSLLNELLKNLQQGGTGMFAFVNEPPDI
ncbi:helix-turn-helix domain-containing protein [Risungbinella massiliensis]|uniref:helix-turn-helix domain-containing protein n=1 Tax=Risungbinella massiliensis TaxID=1329796 RepID=UPI0005CB89D6|nr:helix-turn-helix transcriptional regulator [Risungbinella massiliensis]